MEKAAGYSDWLVAVGCGAMSGRGFGGELRGKERSSAFRGRSLETVAFIGGALCRHDARGSDIHSWTDTVLIDARLPCWGFPRLTSSRNVVAMAGFAVTAVASPTIGIACSVPVAILLGVGRPATWSGAVVAGMPVC